MQIPKRRTRNEENGPVSLVISDHERVALADLAQFPLFAALTGRAIAPVSGRRPDPRRGAGLHQSSAGPAACRKSNGPCSFRSPAAVTGWNFGITHNPSYAPSFPQLRRESATGRTFPSAAGFHTQPAVLHRRPPAATCYPNRDEPPREIRQHRGVDRSHRGRPMCGFRMLAWNCPAKKPYMEGHNIWIGNHPGQPAGIPGGRSRRAPDGEPMVLRCQRLPDHRRHQRPQYPGP